MRVYKMSLAQYTQPNENGRFYWPRSFVRVECLRRSDDDDAGSQPKREWWTNEKIVQIHAEILTFYFFHRFGCSPMHSNMTMTQSAHAEGAVFRSSSFAVAATAVCLFDVVGDLDFPCDFFLSVRSFVRLISFGKKLRAIFYCFIIFIKWDRWTKGVWLMSTLFCFAMLHRLSLVGGMNRRNRHYWIQIDPILRTARMRKFCRHSAEQ